MAILSLLAITLLSSAHALGLPLSLGVESLHAQHVSLKARIMTSLEGMSSAVQNLQSTDSSFRESPVHVHLMQNDTGLPSSACLNALTQPCFANVGIVMEATAAPSASAAVGVITNFCMNCTNPDMEFTNVVTACNSTDAEMLATLTRLVMLQNAACDDESCAGNVLWSFSNITSRRDTFCPNLECGIPIFEVLLGETLANATEDNDCAENLFELNCLTDETNATIYCMDFVEDSNGLPVGIYPTDFCSTSCPGYLSVLMRDLVEDQCIDDDVDRFADCPEYDFRLVDICITNDDGFCFNVIRDEPNLTECGTLFDMIGSGAPANCSEGCRGQLQAFATDVGCCAGFFLEIHCVSSVIIGEACGLAYDTCSRPALPSIATNATTATTATNINATGGPNVAGTSTASMVDTSVVLVSILSAALTILS